MNIALTQTAASVYQMIRGIIVVIVAFMAWLFLKKKQYRHHITSLIVLFIGVFLVGLSSLLFPDDTAGGSTSAMGIGLLLISQIFAGTQFIVEEKLLGDYYLDPLKVVGFEGMWGFIYYLIALPIF
jgi:drug/metabolite transporter (DMT)-like permease